MGSKTDYTEKVDALLDNARDFTRQDFVDLMWAAADQAGVDLSSLGRLRRAEDEEPATWMED